jgi:hypothetical protein
MWKFKMKCPSVKEETASENMPRTVAETEGHIDQSSILCLCLQGMRTAAAGRKYIWLWQLAMAHSLEDFVVMVSLLKSESLKFQLIWCYKG